MWSEAGGCDWAEMQVVWTSHMVGKTGEALPEITTVVSVGEEAVEAASLGPWWTLESFISCIFI